MQVMLKKHKKKANILKHSLKNCQTSSNKTAVVGWSEAAGSCQSVCPSRITYFCVCQVPWPVLLTRLMPPSCDGLRL